MKTHWSPSRRLLGFTVSLLVVSGCGVKTINQIRAEPQRYTQQDVTVAGQVTESFSIAGRGVYEIDDRTGKLWVFSTQGVPRKDSRVEVKGRIRDGFDLGSLTGILIPQSVRDRIGSGLMLIESSHKAKN